MSPFPFLPGRTRLRNRSPLPAKVDGSFRSISSVPTWDANKVLEGGIKRSGRRIKNPARGEVEFIIPGFVSPKNIVRYGRVTTSASGLLMVKEWGANPRFEPQ